MITWPNKDPDEVLDYNVDWTARLEAGETISTSTFLLIEGDIVLGVDSKAGAVTKVWISGGTDATRAVVTNRIVTSEDRTYDQSMRLRIGSH